MSRPILPSDLGYDLQNIEDRLRRLENAPLVIPAGFVSGSMIAPDAITSSHIGSGAVGSDEIADGSVGDAELGIFTVTTTEISAGTIDTSDLSAATISALSVPPGVICPYADNAAPTGWLICAGQSVSTSTYAALFGVIGYAYGGSGGSFTIPDLRGRIPIGMDNQGGSDAGRLTTANTLGANGGSETVILGSGEIPNHTHGVNINSGYVAGSNHNHTVGPAGMQYVGAGGNGNVNAGTAWACGSGFTTGLENQNHYHNVAGNTGGINEGSGAAHNNMPPFLTVYYIIKT